MRHTMMTKRISVAAIVMVFFFLTMPSHAVNINAVPSIALEGGWDSNVFSTSSDEQSDTFWLATPALALHFGSYQTTTEISVGFEFKQYTDHSELDGTTTIIRVASTAPLQLSPRFSLSPIVGFFETEDSWRRNQLISSPTPGIPPADQIVTGRTKTRDYRVGLTMSYLISPTVDFSLGGGVAKTDRTGTDTELEDSQTIFGDTSLNYRINPRFSSGVYIRANYETWDRSPDAQIYSGGLQGTYTLTQNYNLQGRAGVAYSQSDADTTGESQKDWTPTGGFSINYTRKYFTATLAASTEPSGGTGFGLITDRLTVDLDLTDQFAERWWWSLTGSYQRNKSLDESVNETIQTMWGTGELRYTATDWASFSLSGDIFRQRSHAGGGNIDGERVFLGVDLSAPYKLY
jgi:hypothetical protein